MATVRKILKDAKLLSTYWGKRITLAQKNGRFTEGDRKKADSWVTCACGRSTADIPRMRLSEPVDSELTLLGYDFSQFVKYRDFRAAAVTLVKIEQRAREVASHAAT